MCEHILPCPAIQVQCATTTSPSVFIRSLPLRVKLRGSGSDLPVNCIPLCYLALHYFVVRDGGASAIPKIEHSIERV